jgi:DNA (cytosine-5)-methyltransferase 1
MAYVYIEKAESKYMSTQKIRAIDLFCGAGGSSFGAAQAGIEIAAGFDMWDIAIKAYKTNFPSAMVFEKNLQNLSDDDIHQFKSSLGDIDLILASPECTNHSKAKGKGERDEESKKTAFEAVRFAREFKPRWMVIENVTEFEAWERFKELLEDLWGLNYFVRKVKLNSKDFGVPQSRERLFLLCSLSGKTDELVFEQENMKPVSSIIDVSEKYKFSLLEKSGRAKNTLISAQRAINSLGKNQPFLLVYYSSGRKGNGGWQKVSEPLGTITTLDRFAYVIPGKDGHLMRMLQPEELKLAMGFTPKFKLDSIEGLTRRNRVKLMGNGVCPPVMTAIVRSLVTNG